MWAERSAPSENTPNDGLIEKGRISVELDGLEKLVWHLERYRHTAGKAEVDLYAMREKYKSLNQQIAELNRQRVLDEALRAEEKQRRERKMEERRGRKEEERKKDLKREEERKREKSEEEEGGVGSRGEKEGHDERLLRIERARVNGGKLKEGVWCGPVLSVKK